MILVTGGSGFLGAHLLVQLSTMDVKIVAAKRVTTDLNYVKRVFEKEDASDFFERIEWKNIDLFDVYDTEDALEGIEEIYHCASEVSFDPRHHERMVKNNVTITANLVNASLTRGIKKFMFVSSIAALGRSTQEEIIDESRIWKNDPVNSKYGLSKYKSEMEVWRGYEEGLNVIVVNPAVILGYCPWNEGTGKMFDKVQNGMKYYTNGYTGWVDVKDVASCMVQLMQKNTIGERYILTSETKPFRWVFDEIATNLNKPKAKNAVNIKLARWVVLLESWRSKLIGKSPMITKETMRNAMLRCDYINQKVRKELNFNFRPVKDSIKETAEWFLKESNN